MSLTVSVYLAARIRGGSISRRDPFRPRFRALYSEIVIGDPNLAFAVMMAGVLGIYAGLCGRVVIGVAGGVAAVVGLASLAMGGTIHIHWWVALAAGVPVGGVTIFLLRTASRARQNKSV